MVGRTGARRTAAAGLGLALIAALAIVMTGSAGATARAHPASITLHRCGFIDAQYGRSAVFPWQISCSAADTVILDSAKRSDQIFSFSPGVDGGVVKVGSQKWVCTGQMGGYQCGYPYRPYTSKGLHGYKGPFTQAVEWATCKVIGNRYCGTTSEFDQPQT